MATEDALVTESFCYLTTTGRISGRPRTIEIWFGLRGETLYMLSGNRERADWVKNALREPRVTIKIRDKVFAALARMTKDDAEEALVRHLLYEKYSLTEDQAKTDLSISDWARGGLPVAFDVILPLSGNRFDPHFRDFPVVSDRKGQSH